MEKGKLEGSQEPLLTLLGRLEGSQEPLFNVIKEVREARGLRSLFQTLIID